MVDGGSDGGGAPGGDHGGNNNGDDADGGRRRASEPQPPPPTRVAAVLPGLANAPREAALEERGFVLDGLAEFWAAAAAAAKVARFCNCRALIPGERSQRGWCQTWAARQWRGWTGTVVRFFSPPRLFNVCLPLRGVCGVRRQHSS